MAKIVDRILEFIDYEKLSINEFSKRIQVSNGYFAKQKANEANIGSNIIEKIVSIFPELNLNWLITGEGEMIKTSSDIINKAPPENCLLCKEKDKRINDLQKYIQTQAAYIEHLREANLKEESPASSSGQKRKAG